MHQITEQNNLKTKLEDNFATIVCYSILFIILVFLIPGSLIQQSFFAILLNDQSTTLWIVLSVAFYGSFFLILTIFCVTIEMKYQILSIFFKEQFSSSKKTILLLLFISLLIAIPYMLIGSYQNDALVLLSIAKTVQRSLLLGQFPSWENHTLAGNPVLQFYGYSYFIILAFLMFFFPPMLAPKILNTLLIILFSLVMYAYLLLLTNHNRIASFTGAILSIIVPYRAGLLLSYSGHISVNFYYLMLILVLFLVELLLVQKEKHITVILTCLLALATMIMVIEHIGWAYVSMLIIGLYFLIRVSVTQFSSPFYKVKQIWGIILGILIGLFLSCFHLIPILLEKKWTLLELYSFADTNQYPYLVFLNRYYVGISLIIATTVAIIYVFRKRKTLYYPPISALFFLIFLYFFKSNILVSTIIPFMDVFPLTRMVHFITLLAFICVTSLFSESFSSIGKLKIRPINNVIKEIKQKKGLLLFIVVLLTFSELSFLYFRHMPFLRPPHEDIPFEREEAYNWINKNSIATTTRIVDVTPDGSRKLDQQASLTYRTNTNQLLGVGMETSTHVYKYAYGLMNLLHYQLYNNVTDYMPYTYDLLSMFNVEYILGNTPGFVNFSKVLNFGNNYSIFKYDYPSYVTLSKSLIQYNPDDFYRRVEHQDQNLPLGLNIYDADPFASSNMPTYEILDKYKLEYESNIAVNIPVRNGDSINFTNPENLSYSISSLIIKQKTTNLRISVNQRCFIQISQAWYPTVKISVNGEKISYWKSALNLIAFELPQGENEILIEGGLSDTRKLLLIADVPVIIGIIGILIIEIRKKMKKKEKVR